MTSRPSVSESSAARTRSGTALDSQFEAAVQSLQADVELAVRDVESFRQSMQARSDAQLAAEADVNYLQRRWEMPPGDDRSASFLLEDLLDSQDRLALEEFGLAQAPVDYALSLCRRNRALGTLLLQENVEIRRTVEDGLPTIRFDGG